MPIILSGSGSTAESPILVSDILSATEREVQNRFANSSVIINYVDKIHRMIVRRRKWNWLLSDFQTFITRTGQTDYWIGATGSQSGIQTDTTLNLSDIYKVRAGWVLDPTDWRELTQIETMPVASQWRNQDGSWRLGSPGIVFTDPNTPNLIRVYPAPDRGPDYLLVPEPPRVLNVAGGALTARVYFVRLSFLDALGNEGATTTTATRAYVAASTLAKVKSPVPFVSQSGSGVPYSTYNVYASTTEGSETLQNVSPVSVGTDWTEPTSGLVTGADPTTSSDLEPLDGYVLQFRYEKRLTALTTTTDQLLIPARYQDVVCAGVNWLATQYDRKAGQPGSESSAMWSEVFQSGVAQMTLEQNPWPASGMFMKPDEAAEIQPRLRGRIVTTQ